MFSSTPGEPGSTTSGPNLWYVPQLAGHTIRMLSKETYWHMICCYMLNTCTLDSAFQIDLQLKDPPVPETNECLVISCHIRSNGTFGKCEIGQCFPFLFWKKG